MSAVYFLIARLKEAGSWRAVLMFAAAQAGLHNLDPGAITAALQVLVDVGTLLGILIPEEKGGA